MLAAVYSSFCVHYFVLPCLLRRKSQQTVPTDVTDLAWARTDWPIPRSGNMVTRETSLATVSGHITPELSKAFMFTLSGLLSRVTGQAPAEKFKSPSKLTTARQHTTLQGLFSPLIF